MRKYFILIAFVALMEALLFTGCDDFSGFHYRGENDELYSAALYAIPGCENIFDAKTEVVETDRYGRVLFSFSAKNSLLFYGTGKYVNAVMIVQQVDDESISWYPDAAYRFTDTTETDQLQDEIDLLKEMNDWDKPLAPERFESHKTVDKRSMSRSSEYLFTNAFRGADLSTRVLEKAIPFPGEKMMFEVYDMDATGKVIVLWCVVYRYAADPSSPEIYFVQLAHVEDGRVVLDEQLRADSLDELQQRIIELRGSDWLFKDVKDVNGTDVKGADVKGTVLLTNA